MRSTFVPLGIQTHNLQEGKQTMATLQDLQAAVAAVDAAAQSLIAKAQSAPATVTTGPPVPAEDFQTEVDALNTTTALIDTFVNETPVSFAANTANTANPSGSFVLPASPASPEVVVLPSDPTGPPFGTAA